MTPLGLRRPCVVAGGALACSAGEFATGWGGPGRCAEEATGLKRTATARLGRNRTGARRGAIWERGAKQSGSVASGSARAARGGAVAQCGDVQGSGVGPCSGVTGDCAGWDGARLLRRTEL